ncbi:MAG: chorismate transformation enzyme, FkbO/Hyg5 family [Thiobacillus sp.]
MLQLEYLPASRLAHGHPGDLADVLGGICFARPAAELQLPDLPLLAVDLETPPGQAPVCEIWRSSEPLASGRAGAIRYRESESLLFGCVELDESAGTDGKTPLQAATEAAYGSVFALLEARGYRDVLRFWNYFPAINTESHASERYRQFNVGRQDAFLAHGHAVIGAVPAACALGSAGGPLHLAFLAARAPVVSVENPRQVSAYHYPNAYGPRSPTFSRAGLARLGGQDMLFVSGTASIVGHETLHRGDVAAQTRESLHNIAAVAAEAARHAPSARFGLDALAYKVYVRRAEDLAAVREVFARTVGADVTAVFLRADVCRADLLVEIEASGGHALGPGAQAFLTRRPSCAAVSV